MLNAQMLLYYTVSQGGSVVSYECEGHPVLFFSAAWLDQSGDECTWLRD